MLGIQQPILLGHQSESIHQSSNQIRALTWYCSMSLSSASFTFGRWLARIPIFSLNDRIFTVIELTFEQNVQLHEFRLREYCLFIKLFKGEKSCEFCITWLSMQMKLIVSIPMLLYPTLVNWCHVVDWIASCAMIIQLRLVIPV